MPAPSEFPKRPTKPTPLHPRRVRGGVRPRHLGEGAPSWASQRWLRLIEASAAGTAQIEGLQYARQGQTRQFSVGPGAVAASVQGRADRPYAARLEVAVFAPERWDRVVGAMAEGALYAAKMLSGDLPPSIEDVFSPAGLRLFPSEPGEVTASCTCTEPTPWCKHACCAAYLLADRLQDDPWLMFTLRGLERAELIERLRQRRAIAGVTGGAAAVYGQRVPGVSDVLSPPLASCLDCFWDEGPGLEGLELPLTPPAVSHPLLRRLGPSPFQSEEKGRAFPLVGLLATCYDLIGEAARHGPAAPEARGGVAPGEV